MTDRYFDKTVEFLRQLFKVEISNYITPKLKILDNIAIKEGTIICNQNVEIGDLLHEAGHLAVCPSEIRSCMSGDLAIALEEVLNLINPNSVDYRWMNFSCGAAIGWAYLIGLELQIPSEKILKTTFEDNTNHYIFLFENQKISGSSRLVMTI